jgi:uncharacterized protein YjbJ (UPF0337 family)
MESTGSRSGYGSTAEMAQAQTKKATGALSDDEQMEQDGKDQEARATATQDRIMEPWARGQAAEEMKADAAK